MKLLLNKILFLSVATVVFICCKKEYSCEGCINGNIPPLANAGPDQTFMLPKDSVLLDGSASSDADGTITSYKWAKVAGPASALIKKPDSSQTVIKNLVAGAYQFELTVTDNGGLLAQDTVMVMVAAPGNHPPVACAWADQTITLPTNNVTLNGSCSVDPDNNITTYAWTKVSGPSLFNLADANSVQTQVTNLAEGNYQFELKVTDANGLFSKDTVQVKVNAAVVSITCGDTNRPSINANLIYVGTLSTPRLSMAVASAGNKILFAGGGDNLSRVDIYDIGTNAFSTAELSVGRSYGIAAIGVGEKVFFAGGEASDGTFPTNNVDIYNTVTNTWAIEHLSLSGEYLAATSIGDKVIFAGGSGGFSGRLPRSKRVDIYHLSTNTWSTAELSENKNEGHNAVAINDKVFIAGGYTGDWADKIVSDKIDIYDNTTNLWSTAVMQEGKTNHAAVKMGSNIYWAGGYSSNSPGNPTCSVEIRNAGNGSSTKQVLHAPGRWLINDGQNAIIKNNQIVFFTRANATTTFDVYDVTSGTWKIGMLPVSIKDASIICVNNVIYVAGGVVNGALSDKVWKLEF